LKTFQASYRWQHSFQREIYPAEGPEKEHQLHPAEGPEKEYQLHPSEGPEEDTKKKKYKKNFIKFEDLQQHSSQLQSGKHNEQTS
jgi:hypothetical protein